PLRLRAAALVADPEVVRERHVGALAQAAEPLRVDPGSDDAVLERDVLRPAQADAVPPPELDRDVVEDHVAAFAQADRVLLLLPRRQALTDAEVADDDVVRLGEGHLVVLDPDPVAGGALAEDGDVAGDVEDRLQLDVAADVEDHDPRALADGVAQRTRA